MLLELFAILLTLLWVTARFRRGFIDGLLLSIVLLLCYPTYLRITLPQPLPALTIHRLILLIILAFWIREQAFRHRAMSVPLAKPFMFWAAAGGLSVLFTKITFVTSLKDYLEFVFEIYIFFLIVCTTIRDRVNAVRLLKSVWLGFCVVAVLAIIEKYTGFNPVDRFIAGYDRGKGYSDVVSIFPQRIMLGTAMAMGWPLIYCLSSENGKAIRVSARQLWVSGSMFIACCYFSASRGPWLAAATAGIVLAWLGSRVIRRQLIYVLALAGLVLAVRPGVFETLMGKAEETADKESLKGGTFRFRLELWKIAWNEVTKSPELVLFGYGLGAGREIELSWNLSYRDASYLIDSWDNHFAHDLYQSGIFGLAASLTLHFGAGLMLLACLKRSSGESRDFLAGCIASIGAMVFMMTNVLIFSKQLNFAFWSIFASGIAYASYYSDGFLPPAKAPQLRT